MNPLLLGIGISAGLLIGMVACLEWGYRLGRRSSATCELPHEGVAVVEAALFGLLGLLLGFSFAVGISRLDTRRQQAVDEANAIGTAYLRLNLLPAGAQPELRRLFREYLEARLDVYRQLPDLSSAEREIARAAQVQQRIWSAAVEASRAGSTPTSVPILVLPAINQMIDATTPRTVALYTHLPRLILVLLMGVALLTALLAGYAISKRGKRSYLHMLTYAVVVVMTIYTIMDLQNPRVGLIQLGEAETALGGLRESIR